MRLKYLIRKELIQMRHNVFLPRMIVLFPIVLICVAPWITSMEIKDVKVAIVDNDRSQTSLRIVHRIEHSEYFKFCGMVSSYDNARLLMEKDETDVIVVIPRHYERDMINGMMPQVYITANSVNGTKGMMGTVYLARITGREQESLTQLSIIDNILYNKHQDYKLFMIPALTAVLIVMMCGFMPALNIVGEKEAGTIEQINVTPVRKWEFILAKLIPYWIVGLFVVSACLLLSWIIYGFTPAGNVLFIYLLVMLLALVFSGIGLTVSNYSNQMQQAMFVMWFIMVCCILLSGLFTPVQSMPHWAQLLTTVNPMRYFIDAMRTVFVRGGTFGSILPRLSVLAVIAVLINVWAVTSYRKNQ
ncbi:ABC transporter permease [Prevotella sp. OH937_COT-195]|uniref:ABC transporter permease n=1 Tax=Prevotella sp. OH937_COT-195 TaxID=2491051 RepID=UPI000F655232|nr:ABC transporter permease [Prevotella sp. OH937_COT-195]RRD02912.1 ABC transporter permease [Prevotella sp. OH937_COT-195]